MKDPVQETTLAWRQAILSTFDGADGGTNKVKRLRKMVLVSMQTDEEDKQAKKSFKRAIQSLEKDKILHLNADGRITRLTNSKLQSEHPSDDSPKGKRRKLTAIGTDYEQNGESREDFEIDAENLTIARHSPCPGNPQGVTRLFLGNLPFAVDEAALSSFLLDGVTHIKWITDKETGKFYGSAFVEMKDAKLGAQAVQKAGESLVGRPIKINFAPARPGDVWPPAKSVILGGSAMDTGCGGGGGGGATAGGSGIRAMSAKPEHCTKLFVGNCSFEIDDDTLIKFFAAIDAEVKAVRWLHHRDSGDFKGCGFVEFWDTKACERAASLNGKNLLGRPIRLDWTE